MGTTKLLDRGRGSRSLPLLLAWLVGILLVLDIGARLAGVEIPLAAGRTFGGSMSVAQFGGLVWNGVIVGLIFGLAGIGLSMTYSILNFANFSHGDLITTGAFTGWGAALLVSGWGLAEAGTLLLVRAASGPSPNEIGASIIQAPLAIAIGVVVAAVATVLVTVAIDRVVYRPMRDRGGIPLLIASIGVALGLRYVVQFVFGSRSRGVTATDGVRTTIAGVSVNLHELTLFVVALVLMGGMHLLLQRTKLGTAMRAMADNKDLALVTGIPTERVVTATWILGGALAGVAGYLYVLERGTIEFNIGWFLLLFIFAAVILGGIGSIYGAIAGGLVIGLVHEVSLVWISGDFNAAAAFLIMVIVLLYRPEGLFSGVTTA